MKKAIKTKEELLAEMKGNAKFQQKLKFTKEKLYPAVINASLNIDDAKMFLSSINNVLMEKFLGEMKKLTFKELKIVEGLDEKAEKYKEYKELLALFDDMSVFDAKDYLEGMKNEIDVFITDEMKNRPLSSLKAKWIDEM